MPDTNEQAVREVAADVFEVEAPFWGYPLYLYFVRDRDRWAVVDTGIDTTPREFIEPFLRDRGGVGSLELVLGTHGHVDHVGGNGALKALVPDVRLSVHEKDLGWAESVDRHFEQLYRLGEPEAWIPDAETEELIRGALGEAAAIDHILADCDELAFGGDRRIAVTHVGGHSPGHVVMRDLETGAVFCGDALQGNGALNQVSGKRDFPMYRTVADYLAGLDTIEAMRPEILCTAHAGTYVGAEDALVAITTSRQWVEGFHGLVRELAAADRDFSLGEMAAAVSEARPEHAVALQIFVTTAEHLNELVRTAELEPYIADGTKRWKYLGR